MTVNLRVLVIDDDPDVLTTVSTILMGQGCDVVTAADGRKGVQCLHTALPNLILVDVLMPEMDGIETIRAIRADGYRGRIVVMTGGGGRLSADELIRMTVPFGADSALRKPFNAEQLLSALDNPAIGAIARTIGDL